MTGPIGPEGPVPRSGEPHPGPGLPVSPSVPDATHAPSLPPCRPRRRWPRAQRQPASAQTTLQTELFVQGVSQATDLTFAPGDPTRIFVVQQGGIIRVVENGTLLSTPFLNIDPIVQSGGERGLLGLAFHPDYQSNGRFFVNYTEQLRRHPCLRVRRDVEPERREQHGRPDDRLINQDFSNHNGGCIKFGPDGMLYVGMGDGGSGNDPNNRAQNGNSLLGKMLRYDVDIAAPYIPADNPFVGTSGINNAICHIGLRNPWRFTFDRQTGDMWIGDVGQNAREEIDFIPAGVLGENLGWRCKEGNRCTNLSGCACSDGSLLDPIQEYNHSGGNCSVTGGMIYRGSAIPTLLARTSTRTTAPARSGASSTTAAP